MQPKGSSSNEFPPPTEGRETLRGKTAFITGAARGLGAAIAEALAEAGARVVLADVNGQLAEAQAASLAERGADAWSMTVDIRHPEECASAITEVATKHGRLDILVNNAAIDVTAPLLELQVRDWQRVLATNLYAPLVLCKHAAEVMSAQPTGGHVVNIASTASKRAWPNASAYHATKWGLLGMSHALHAELRVHRIRVTAVVAGGMRTPFLLDRFPDIDVDRLQEPRNVAQAVRFVLEQPEGTCIPEIMVLPSNEGSWP
jgi:NAD(P)-dependent dehydrogenase (short-subunit alcohol dehydrogenase family)